MSSDFFFETADESHRRREKAKARELRASQWWKNQKAKGICYYCKERFHPQELTMDHKIPVVRGGKSNKNNIVPSCKECNNEKKYHLTVEWKGFNTDE